MKIRLFLYTLLALLLFGLGYCYLFYGNCLFLFRFVAEPERTGSITPTSKTAARELIQPMLALSGPRTILEVGAGSGPVTEVIIKELQPGDRFDVLEIDPSLCDLLQDRFKEYDQVHVHCTPVERWRPAYRYDAIISTIPFNNLSVTIINAILERFEQLGKSGGTVSYLEYIGGAELKNLLAKDKQEAQAKSDRLKAFRDEHNTHTATVVANVPPTYVHHVTL